MGPCLDTVTVRGRVREPVDGGELRYEAAAPATANASFSGSGLPHPSPAHALDGTPNRGAAKVASDGAYEFTVVAPGAYYSDFAGTLVPPGVRLTYTSLGAPRSAFVRVGDPHPFRTLTYDRRRTSPAFYAAARPLAVRDQERVLRDSAYGAAADPGAGFWGGAVPAP